MVGGEEKAVAAGGPEAVSFSTGKLKGELQKQASFIHQGRVLMM